MTNEQDRFRAAQWILERQIGWIATADVKVGVIVAIQTAMVGGLAAALGTTPQKTEWALGCAIVAFICAIGAFMCAAFAVFPRTDGPPKSLLYFGRICALKQSDYVSQLRFATGDELLTDCADQIHCNAKIAETKHCWVKNAMIWSFLAAPPWVIAILLLVPSQVST
ncbi:MAG: DUF5706 domain-containing protein [Sulfuritalea sp.]|jgi:hypothetical protein|nr:DUF5706 domain-containing protein [Sulfuritalea sp.]